MLEPFGQGNEKPQFAQKDLNIRSVRVLGRNRNAVKLCLVTDKGTVMDAMLFADGDEFAARQAGHRMMDIIYYPAVNEYNGRRSLQVTIKDYKLH